MNTDNKFFAEWYEDDSIDEYEGFMSDVSHTQPCISLASAKSLSQRNALKHGSMVVGMVTEREYSTKHGWEAIAEYVCEHFDGEWCKWERRAA